MPVDLYSVEKFEIRYVYNQLKSGRKMKEKKKMFLFEQLEPRNNYICKRFEAIHV